MSDKNLFYILITARCPLACSFCMTKHLHRNEDLMFNDNSINSIISLSKKAKKVCISGEGEPLVAKKSILKILKNSPDNIHYEIITSGFWPVNKLDSFLAKLYELCLINNCTVAFRLSVDPFHDAEMKRNSLSNLFSIAKSNNYGNSITYEIRSITGQEEYVFNKITNELIKNVLTFQTKKKSELQYNVITDKFQFKVQFKPTVSPINFNYKDEWEVFRYIEYIEKNREMRFHIGLINDNLNNPQFDITIEPTGNLVLYGLEPFPIGNIYEEVIDYNTIVNKVRADKNLNYLTSKPFSDLLLAWKQNPNFDKIITSTNNPFWIIRDLYAKTELEFSQYIKNTI